MCQLLEMIIPEQEVNGDRVPRRRTVTLPIIASEEVDRAMKLYLQLPSLFFLEEGIEDDGTAILACYWNNDEVLRLNWVQDGSDRAVNIAVTAARVTSKHPDL